MFPPCYGIIIDEASGVCQREQLNIQQFNNGYLSNRGVDGHYLFDEDAIGLVCLPNTAADDTLFTVVKDILIRCGPSIELCRRQALEANMKLRECFGSFEFFSAHSLAHSLHMCLQDAGRKLEVYS